MSAVRPAGDAGVEIELRVVARASRDAVVGLHPDGLRVRVRAPPVDGAANEAVRALLADALAVRTADVTIAAGHTAKRKLIRIAGLDVRTVLERLARLTTIALAFATTACEAHTIDVPLKVVLPEDTTELERTDNASLVILPDGNQTTVPVDGLDFELALELAPDDDVHQVQLYLADGEELLGWGQSAPFLFAERATGLELFCGRAGALSTFPFVIEEPDRELRGARAVGRGLVLIRGDGRLFLFDEKRLTAGAGEPHPEPPAAADGAWVGDALGGVQRIAWSPALSSYRYDPGLDAWDELVFVAPELVGDRTDAVAVPVPDRTALVLVGGGTRTDAVRIPLVPDADGRLTVVAEPRFPGLDRPRPGASGTWVPRPEGAEALRHGLLLFGSDAADAAFAFATEPTGPVGPMGPWTGGRCVVFDPVAEGAAPTPVRVLCGGGLRDGMPTADLVMFTFPAVGGDPAVAFEPFAPLPTAMEDPLWLADPGAVYAQGTGRLFRIDRLDRSVTERAGGPGRHRGGLAVALGTGATYLVGGVDGLDAPLSRFGVFVPEVASTAAVFDPGAASGAL